MVALDLPDKNEVSEPIPAVSASADVSGPAILQILPALDEGGGARDTIELARHLADRGWRALVASGGGAGEAELASFGAQSFRLPVGPRNPFAIRANSRRLQRLIRDRHVDLVHVRSRAAAWSAHHAARRCAVPFVTTIHGVYEDARGLFKRDDNRLMATGDRVIAVSDYIAEIRQISRPSRRHPRSSCRDRGFLSPAHRPFIVALAPELCDLLSGE